MEEVVVVAVVVVFVLLVVDVVVEDVVVSDFSTNFILFPFKIDSKMEESSKSYLSSSLSFSSTCSILFSFFFSGSPTLLNSLKIELRVFLGLNLGGELGVSVPSLDLWFADGRDISIYLSLKYYIYVFTS